MERINRGVKILVSVLTAALCAVLIWQAADICRTGTAPDNLTPAGGMVRQMYRRGDIAARLRAIAPLVAVYVPAAVVGTVTRFLTGDREKCRSIRPVEMASDPRRVKCAQAALLVAGLICIGLGIWNGGAWDVLVKAVNICTECIGLG